MNKIWRIKGLPEQMVFSDSELINKIIVGEFNGECVLINAGLKQEVKIKDTIYSYYIKDVNNEESN